MEKKVMEQVDEKVKDPKKLRKRRLPSGVLVTPHRFEELIGSAFRESHPLNEAYTTQEVNFTLDRLATDLEKWLTGELRMAPGYVRMMREIVNKHKR